MSRARCDVFSLPSMIFWSHSTLTLLVGLYRCRALPSVCGTLFPEQALISSALNELHGCGLLYLAAADPCGIRAQLRCKTSPHGGEQRPWDLWWSHMAAYSVEHVQAGEFSVLVLTTLPLSDLPCNRCQDKDNSADTSQSLLACVFATVLSMVCFLYSARTLMHKCFCLPLQTPTVSWMAAINPFQLTVAAKQI